MKIKEFIEELKKFDPELEMWLREDYEPHSAPFDMDDVYVGTGVGEEARLYIE